jgi:hypothetical protein
MRRHRRERNKIKCLVLQSADGRKGNDGGVNQNSFSIRKKKGL